METDTTKYCVECAHCIEYFHEHVCKKTLKFNMVSKFPHYRTCFDVRSSKEDSDCGVGAKWHEAKPEEVKATVSTPEEASKVLAENTTSTVTITFKSKPWYKSLFS